MAAVQSEENYGAKRSEMVEAKQRIDDGVSRKWRNRSGGRWPSSGRTEVQKKTKMREMTIMGWKRKENRGRGKEGKRKGR